MACDSYEASNIDSQYRRFKNRLLICATFYLPVYATRGSIVRVLYSLQYANLEVYLAFCQHQMHRCSSISVLVAVYIIAPLTHCLPAKIALLC